MNVEGATRLEAASPWKALSIPPRYRGPSVDRFATGGGEIWYNIPPKLERRQ